MKKIVLLILMLLTAVSYAQPPRPKFSSGSRNLNFNNVVVGKTKQLSTQFRVDSSASAPVTVICRLPRNPEYQLIGDTQFTIPLGGFQDVTVEFTPTTLGQLRDTIFFTHDGDTSAIKASSTININGTGVESDTFPRITITPGFGFLTYTSTEVGKTSQRSFRIQNSTDTIRQLTGSITPPNPPFSISGGVTSFSLEMDDTVRIFVDFAPTKDTTYFDSVIVTSNADSANMIKKIFLSATGTKPGSDTIPRITITGAGGGGVNFGSLRPDSSVARYITIRNSSIANKQLTGYVGMPTMSVFTVDSGGGSFTIDSGMTAMVKLRFSPATAGSYRDSLYVVSNAIEPTDSVKVVLRGEVVATDVKELPSFVTSISLYPNPAKDHVTSRITLREPTTMSISVFDTKGVEVLTIPSAHYNAGIPDIDFSVKQLPNGTYTVRYSFSSLAVSILMVIER